MGDVQGVPRRNRSRHASTSARSLKPIAPPGSRKVPEMDTNRNLLFGALALQTGLVDSGQFHEACKPSRERPGGSLADALLQRGWIVPADQPHLEYLVQRALDKHQGNARAALAALPRSLRESLPTLEGLDQDRTVADSPSAPSGPSAAPARHSTNDPGPETRYTALSLHGT